MDNRARKVSDSEELAKWVSLAQQGQPDALAEIIALSQNRLYRFCIYLTHNAQLAQDLCQDTFVKSLEKISTLNDPESFLPWLLKMAKRLYLDYRKSRKNHHVSDQDINETVSSVASGADRELSVEVQKTLAKLSAEEKLVILLVDLEGYSYREAGEVIGVSEGAVRSKLHRARSVFSAYYFGETK